MDSTMTATMVYIPPPNFKHTQVFIDNLLKNPPSGRFIILSEHNYQSIFPKAQHCALSVSPDRLQWLDKNKTSGISNALFVLLMRIAKQKGLKHVLYLESDCRVGGRGWDQTVLAEFNSIGFPVIAAGTLMAWNVFNGGPEWISQYHDSVLRTRDFPTPVHCYGMFPIGNKPMNPTLFPNGAGAVLNVDWMHELFEGFTNMFAIGTGEGMEGAAWDWQIGERARKRFGVDVWELFAHLRTVSSCYGDLTMPEDTRLDMLRKQQIFVSHQHKGAKTI
jgi:hypothetical protein